MNFSLLLPPGPLDSLRDGLNQTVGLPAEGSALFNKVFYGIIAADVVIFVLLLACCAMETRDCEHCARCLPGGINAGRAVVREDEEAAERGGAAQESREGRTSGCVAAAGEGL